MILTYHREKLINAIIYFSQNTKYCGKIKLLKLLYFLDFWHFKQTSKSVTGLDYSAWEFGPVPNELYEELTDKMEPDLAEAIKIIPIDKFQKIHARKSFDSKYFTKREKRLLELLVEIFNDAKAEDMVTSTHLLNSPWDKTLKEKGMYQPIDYFLALDSEPESLKYDEVIHRIREREEMYNAFGVEK